MKKRDVILIDVSKCSCREAFKVVDLITNKKLVLKHAKMTEKEILEQMKK